MTLRASLFFLIFNMRLVAIETGWDQSMGRVADIACHLGVLAREFGQLFLWVWMTRAAGVCQYSTHRHFFGRMGNRVTR